MTTIPLTKHVVPVSLILLGIVAVWAPGNTIEPSPYWKNDITFPSDRFCARPVSQDSPRWIKFTILLAPYDANDVYFQDSRRFTFHYEFATQYLTPFKGMSLAQFNAATLFEQGQQAILGTVIMPPLVAFP